MALSKGIRSQLLWKTETTFGTLATGNYNKQPLNSETLAESIETLQAEDLNPNKTNPGLRGANISCGGGLIHDLGGVRNLEWYKHLLSASTITTTTPTITAITNSAVFKRGDITKNTAGDYYVCLRGGTVNDASVGTNLTGTADVTITGAASTTLLFRFICLTGSSGNFRKHVITPGNAFPTGGLSFEKGILGGVETVYVKFAGGRINSYEMTATQAGITKANWNFLFMNSANALTSSGGTPVSELAESPFAGYDTAIFLNDAARTMQSLRPHREFSLQVANNLTEDAFVMGSRSRIDIPDGRRVISGRLSTFFQDDDDYSLFKNETSFAMCVCTIGLDGVVMQWDFPEVKLTGTGTPQISGPGMLQADFNWTAFVQSQSEGTLTVYNMNATNPA